MTVKLICEWWTNGHVVGTVVHCRKKAVARSASGLLCKRHARSTLRSIAQEKEKENGRAGLPNLEDWGKHDRS